MKKKNIFLSIFILYLLFINNSFGEENTKIAYEKYKENIVNYCDEYKNKSGENKLVYNFDEENQYIDMNSEKEKMSEEGYTIGQSKNLANYFVLHLGKAVSEGVDEIDVAKVMYRKNMDKIYDCATTYIYVKSIESIEESIKNTPNLKTKLEKKLEDLKNRKIDDLDDKKCNIKKDNKEIYIKKYVLNQTTYELCRYNYYLSYLEEYNKNIGSSLPDYITKNENKQDYKEILLEDVLESYSFKKSKIDEEIQSSFEVFPKVFSAYSQYENYLTIHLYMDLILKQDYISIRELLHKSIKPINQLGYKIINAMSK